VGSRERRKKRKARHGWQSNLVPRTVSSLGEVNLYEAEET